MKRHFWLVLVGVCLAALSALVGGCIRVIVSPTDETVHADSKPVISSFTAEPHDITQGASSTLSWNISGASTVSIDQGIGNVALTGTRAVTPNTTTTYTLTATNATGSTQAAAQVLVSAPLSPDSSAGLPVINSFVANPNSIATDSSSTLSWSVTNATSVTITPNIGTVAATGSMLVSPSTTTNYILIAVNAAGARSASSIVAVSAEPSIQPNLDWTGTWQITSGQNAFGNVMTLSQNEYQVTGSYVQHENGKINGTASNNMLTGTWSEEPTYSPPHDAGDFQLTMSPDGNSFTGQWRYGSSGDWAGSWSGTRVTSY